MTKRTFWILLLLVAAIAGAQNSSGDYPVFLLQNAVVQKELKLNAATVAKLKKTEKEAAAKYLAMIQPDAKRPDQIRQPNPVILRQERLKNDAAMLALLSKWQKERLLQIGYQYNGAFSFGQSAVKKKLNLSVSQVSKLEKAAKVAMDQYHRAVQPILKPGSIAGSKRPDSKTTAMRLVAAKAAMMKAFNSAADKILTASQRSKWKQMQGKPMDVTSLYNPAR